MSDRAILNKLNGLTKLLNKLKKKYGKQKLVRYLKDLEPHLSRPQKKMNKKYIRYTRFGSQGGQGDSPVQPSQAPRDPASPPMTASQETPTAPDRARSAPAPREQGYSGLATGSGSTLVFPPTSPPVARTSTDDSAGDKVILKPGDIGESGERVPVWKTNGTWPPIQSPPGVEIANPLDSVGERYFCLSNMWKIFDAYCNRYLFSPTTFSTETEQNQDLAMLYYSFTHIKGIENFILAMAAVDLKSKAAEGMEMSFGFGAKVRARAYGARDADDDSDSSQGRAAKTRGVDRLKAYDSVIYEKLNKTKKGRQIINDLRDKNGPVFHSSIIQEYSELYDEAVKTYIDDVSRRGGINNIGNVSIDQIKIDTKQNKDWIDQLRGSGMDFEMTKGAASTKGWENSFKQNGIIGFTPKHWDMPRGNNATGEPYGPSSRIEGKLEDRLTDTEKNKLKRKCRCTLCGCFMFVDQTNPICESMIELEHNLPKSGATQLYLLMYWWTQKKHPQWAITDEEAKYVEFLFFNNIGGFLAETSSIFNYCCKLCNQIKSDMDPIMFQWPNVMSDNLTNDDVLSAVIVPNDECLYLFEQSLKLNFINLFIPTDIVPPEGKSQQFDNKTVWQNCSLVIKVSCAALWGIQFIMTYTNSLEDPYQNHKALHTTGLRAKQLIEIIQDVVGVGTLKFDQDDRTSIEEWYGRMLGGSQGRSRFFGREHNITGEEEGAVYQSLGEKYVGVLKTLWLRSFGSQMPQG